VFVDYLFGVMDLLGDFSYFLLEVVNLLSDDCLLGLVCLDNLLSEDRNVFLDLLDMGDILLDAYLSLVDGLLDVSNLLGLLLVEDMHLLASDLVDLVAEFPDGLSDVVDSLVHIDNLVLKNIDLLVDNSSVSLGDRLLELSDCSLKNCLLGGKNS